VGSRDEQERAGELALEEAAAGKEGTEVQAGANRGEWEPA